jgi:tRNA-dihydrouridine synthase A
LEDIHEPDRDLPNRQICQIGGNSPEMCGKATQVVELEYQYDEVNLNIDCPSDRVSGEREFGAILMKKIDVAYSVLESMKANATTKTPVSIKCRIGVDDWDNFDFISEYIERLLPVCQRFYLHARKCVLNGLFSARQNRSIPPINYPRVYALCRKFPEVEFWINGGIRNLVQARNICYGSSEPEHSDALHNEVPCSQCRVTHGSCIAPPFEMAPSNLRGCMMGRAAIDNPAIFWDVDRYFYGMGSNPCQNRRQVLERYASYLESLYPRRCCDLDEEVTHHIPVPTVTQLRPYCPVCRDQYQTDEEEEFFMVELNQKKKLKISSRLIGRSLKPIRGLFYGIPGGKVFLRILDKAARDDSLRNCGPGFIVWRVVQQMRDDLLDQNFISAEAINNVYH